MRQPGSLDGKMLASVESRVGAVAGRAPLRHSATCTFRAAILGWDRMGAGVADRDDLASNRVKVPAAPEPSFR
jgi:hypothetical protein